MKIVQTENKIVLQEDPFALWVFGLFFIFVGATFVYISLGTNEGRAAFFKIPIILSFFMGMIGVGTGIWLIHRSPISRLIVDRSRRTVMLLKYNLTGKERFIFDFNEISLLAAVEELDSENDPYRYLALRLRNGEQLRITSHGQPADKVIADFALQINDFMGKQMSGAEDVLRIKDESAGKMS